MEEELREITERSFEACGTPLDNVTVFKYLAQVITGVYDDWPAVVGNLQKTRNNWGLLSQILIQEGAVLLLGAETWVVTPSMERALSSFHHRVVRRLTGRKPRRRGGGSW